MEGADSQAKQFVRVGEGSRSMATPWAFLVIMVTSSTTDVKNFGDPWAGAGDAETGDACARSPRCLLLPPPPPPPPPPHDAGADGWLFSSTMAPSLKTCSGGGGSWTARAGVGAAAVMVGDGMRSRVSVANATLLRRLARGGMLVCVGDGIRSSASWAAFLVMTCGSSVCD